MPDETIASRSNIKTILLTGLVSLVVGVGSALLINYFTEKRLKLTYDITTQEVFPGQQNNIGIFALRIVNDGKREIEQVLCHVGFSQGRITERSVAGIPAFAGNVTGSENYIEVTVPFLNPGEQFSVHALLANVSSPLSRPSIDVRGKGILGTDALPDKGTQTSITEVLITTIAVLLSFVTATFTFWFSRRRPQVTATSTGHSGDHRDTIAFVLEIKDMG